MGMRDRYRSGWAARRYSTRTWYVLGGVFIAYIAVGMWLALSNFNLFFRLSGGLLVVVSLVPAVMAFRRAPGSDKA